MPRRVKPWALLSLKASDSRTSTVVPSSSLRQVVPVRPSLLPVEPAGPVLQTTQALVQDQTETTKLSARSPPRSSTSTPTEPASGS